MDFGEAIQVCVRVRPVLPFEASQQDDSRHQSIVSVDTSIASVRVDTHQAEFDAVFGPESSQNDIFGVVREHVDEVLRGVNTTVFAYGQTGSGKTYSMLGAGLESLPEEQRISTRMGASVSSSATPILLTRSASGTAAPGSRADSSQNAASDGDEPTPSGSVAGDSVTAQAANDSSVSPVDEGWGIMPRAVARIFELISQGQASDATFSASVTASYIELYNDRCYDLLQDPRRAKPLAIRERKGAGRSSEVYVEGLSQVVVDSTSGVMRALHRGSRHRAVRATELNASSSRSHAILQLQVDVEQGMDGGVKVLRRAKLSLVDLAGSEKWDVKLELGRARAKELTHINKSLSALGNCIAALTDTSRQHIPYRDSKLTRLLQDSLGGTARTTVIATLSPTEANKEDSISTMVFADRARRVMVNVRPHEVIDDAVLLAQANRDLDRLRSKVRRLNRAERRAAELERIVIELREENSRLRQLLGQRGSSSKRKPKIRSGTKHAKQSTHSGQELMHPRQPPAGRPAVSPITSPRAASAVLRPPRSGEKLDDDRRASAADARSGRNEPASAAATSTQDLARLGHVLSVHGSGALGAHDGDGLSASSSEDEQAPIHSNTIGRSTSGHDRGPITRRDVSRMPQPGPSIRQSARNSSASESSDQYSNDDSSTDGTASNRDDDSQSDDNGEHDDLYRPFEPKSDKVKYYVALANLIDSDEEQTEVGQRIMRLANSFRGKDVQVARDPGGALIVRSESKGIVAQVKLSELADEARRTILQQESELLRGVRSIAREKDNLQKMLRKLLEGGAAGAVSVGPEDSGANGPLRQDTSDIEELVRAKLDALSQGSGGAGGNGSEESDEYGSDWEAPVEAALRGLPGLSHASDDSRGRTASVGDPLNQDGLLSARRASLGFAPESRREADSNGIGMAGTPVGSGRRRESRANRKHKKTKASTRKNCALSPQRNHQRSAAAIDAMIADTGATGGWGIGNETPSRGWSPQDGAERGEMDDGKMRIDLLAHHPSSGSSPRSNVRASSKPLKKPKKKKARRGSSGSEIRAGDLYKDGRAMGRREASDEDDSKNWKLSQLHKGGVGALDIDIVAYMHAKPPKAKVSTKTSGRNTRAKKPSRRGMGSLALGGPGAGRFQFDRKDAGCRVAIRAARYGTLLKGTVAAFDAPRRMHLVVYDSGERRWHDMATKEFRVLKYVSAQRTKSEQQEHDRSDHDQNELDGDIPTSDIDANAAAATFAYAPHPDDKDLDKSQEFYLEPENSSPQRNRESIGLRGPTPVRRPRRTPARNASKPRRQKIKKRLKPANSMAPQLGMAGFGQSARPSRTSMGRSDTGIRLGSVRDAGGSSGLVQRYGSTYASGIVGRADAQRAIARRTRKRSRSKKKGRQLPGMLPPL